jgi:hypothetical protein
VNSSLLLIHVRVGGAASVAVDGVTGDQGSAIAGRWAGEVVTATDEVPVGQRLEVPEIDGEDFAEEPHRIPIVVRAGEEPGMLRVGVGPNSLFLGAGRRMDRVRFSDRRAPSRLEYELLIDLGINHLLARQGLPVLHSCSYEVGDTRVLGLGESFSGKTTVAVAAMRAGGRVVSDDAVLVVPEGGRFGVLPVRSYGWLRGRTREIVPGELRDRMIENEEDGQPRWVLNRKDGGEAFVERAVPDVIWVQSIDRRLKLSRIEPIDQGQVFAALIRASSPLFLSRHCPEIRDRLIPVFRSLCAQCRGYRVRLGRQLLEEPAREITRLVELSR